MTPKIKMLVILLGVSLAANIFVMGTMIGKELRPTAPHAGPPMMDFNMKRLDQYLDKSDRSKIHMALKNHRSEMRQSFQKMRASEQRIKELMSAETLDKEALLKAFEAHTSLKERLHTPMQKLMVDVIADLNVSARKHLARAMFQHKMHRRMRMDDRQRDRESPESPESEVH